jgi:hypothetical protein
MTNYNKEIQDKEIDLSAIGRGFKRGLGSLGRGMYNLMRFLLKNAVILAILVVAGVAIGYFMDKKKGFTTEIIVAPNFNSADYVYAKVALLQSRIKMHDSVFLTSVGLKDTRKLLKIDIAPITDVYQFMNSNETNYKVFELMAEDSNIDELLNNKTTSMNYRFHKITFVTLGKTSPEKTIEPLLAYLNDSEYFEAVQKEYLNNVSIKLRENDTLIRQIDDVLAQAKRASAISGNMIYNGDSQINDIIDSKDKLIHEQGNLRLSLKWLDKIVKDNTVTMNIAEYVPFFEKMKVLIPILLILLFAVIRGLVRLYQRYSIKPA